jgi:hypothetical protein
MCVNVEAVNPKKTVGTDSIDALQSLHFLTRRRQAMGCSASTTVSQGAQRVIVEY